MYPRNAASPEPIAIGPVVQISDGAVQTSGCTVRIKPIGVSEGDGAGTTAYSTDGVVLYTPTQAETNYTSFVLIAKKTGCIPACVTVVTTEATVAGRVSLGMIQGDAQSATDLKDFADAGYDPSTNTVTTADAANIASILSNTFVLSSLCVAQGTVDAGSTSTTVVLEEHPYGNNDLIGLLIVVRDDTTDANHPRWITDYDANTNTVTLHEALPFTLEANVDSYKVLSIRRDSGLTAGEVTAAVPTVLQIQSGLATSANQTIMIDGIGFITAQQMGACADAGTAGETYQITFGGATYTLDFVGLDSTGNRTSVTRTKT